MDLGALIKSLIFVVSSSLLYPALILLTLLSAWMLFQLGGFVAEWAARARLPRTPPERLAELLLEGKDPGRLARSVRAYLKRLRGLLDGAGGADEAVVTRALEDASTDLLRSLERVRLVVRVGPGLGLIGTLIPMGTGLAALNEGDLTQLSSDLVIAFTTTVVGLALGITSFFVHVVRRRWANEDIGTMEFATEILARPRNDE